MIISSIQGACRTLDGDEELRWRSLARRGMLHCECESFDYLRLSPGTKLALRGSEGTESAWLVVAGSGLLALQDDAATRRLLRAGDLVLLPAGEEGRFIGGHGGLELLWLAVMPRDVSRAMPPRRPVA
ncbi:cupin domain-containing protein [Polyangium aurulentum]|uniref:cupin domain-containing protein n=1 Tax=Polyangium aurulentum TaxID=2567896 RepID=UPI0010AED8EC|nr:cupin domain-containing protein [Polyangium aurulentum]UQA56804.1 cupin domain-containing protein [Polyangium aurulentum]